MVEKWEAEVLRGATIGVPKINRADNSACRLLACVVTPSQHFGPDDATPICKPTWTDNLVAPYMNLIEDPELKGKFDSATAYSIKRSEVLITRSSPQAKAAEEEEAKRLAKEEEERRLAKEAKAAEEEEAKRLAKEEKERRLAKGAKAAEEEEAKRLAKEAKVAEAPAFQLADDSVKLARWCLGDEVFVYEVVVYSSGLFIAAEIHWLQEGYNVVKTISTNRKWR
ncbi:hypothetical protein HDU86_001850 [Geranomyces michiganensis]|nr:hypothetical protein HDU86_001850 [Geranomyces michiganensis]